MLKHVLRFLILLSVVWMSLLTTLSDAQQPTLFEVIATTGEPHIRRGGWKTEETSPVAVGAFVSTNDILEIDVGESVTIYCEFAENPTHTMYGRSKRVPSCPQPVVELPPVPTPEGDITPSPYFIPAEEFAQLISAYNLVILEPIMKIDWPELPGAASYDVVITSEAMLPIDILQTSFSEISLMEALEIGTYNVSIQPLDESGNKISIPTQVDTITFEVADRVTTDGITADISMIESALGSENSITDYTKAIYFAGHGYMEEGIDLLVGLIQPAGDENDQLRGSAQVYLALGELYQRNNQLAEAKDAFESGLAIALQGTNVEQIAQLQTGLARTVSDRERAAELYAEAIAFYEMVGDDGLLDLLQEELHAIN